MLSIKLHFIGTIDLTKEDLCWKQSFNLPSDLSETLQLRIEIHFEINLL